MSMIASAGSTNSHRVKFGAALAPIRRSGGALGGLFSVSVAFLAGCTPKASPSLPLFGAFFPSWLLCAVIGVIGSVVVRAIFVSTGMDDQLPLRSIVYVCVAATIAFGVSLFVYGR
jgi:hypothetical protein